MSGAWTEHVTQAAYLAATALFIFSLKWLSHPSTARRGIVSGVLGMAAAIGGTLLYPEIVDFTWIGVAVVIGVAIGVPLSRVPLTAVPQRTALSHAFGGLAAGWFAWVLKPELRVRRPRGPFPTRALRLERTPETMLERLLGPAAVALLRVSTAVRRLQHGRLQAYILYGVVGLVALGALVTWAGTP